MSDSPAKTDPLPVLPLDYAAGDSESLRAVLRLVVWIFILGQASVLAHYLLDVGCYFWEQNDRFVLRKALHGVPLVIKAPTAILSLYLLLNSPAMLKLSAAGRRWILFGAVAGAILAFLGELGLSLDAIIERNVFFYGSAYGLQYAGQYWISAVAGFLWYLVIFLLFRSRANGGTTSTPGVFTGG